MRRVVRCARAAALLLGAGLASAQCASASSLDVWFDKKGLSGVVHNGVQVIRPEGVRVSIPALSFATADGSTRHVNLPKPKRESFDERMRTLTAEFEWGKVSCTYTHLHNRLDITVRVTNASKEPISSVQVLPLRLVLPKLHQNLEVTAGYTGALLRHDKGTIALVNWEIGWPVTVQLLGSGNVAGQDVKVSSPVSIQTQVEIRPHHPIVDDKHFVRPGRPIAPGGSGQYKVTLAFGPPEATAADLVGDFYQHVSETMPMTLSWPDRRPIAMIFFANPDTKWRTNPRGYVFGKRDKEDLTTAEGLRDFGNELMKYADRCIQMMRDMNAQGVIVWDLEGQEMPHQISYVGNPQKIAEVAPEMDRYADAFMKKFTDAGFRTGVTIRPTEFYAPGNAKKPKWWHRDVKDPVALMAAQIAYAKKRWKSTIIYLDSNVFGSDFDTVLTDKRVPFTMPVDMIRTLHEMHPQILIIPEWSSFEYYRYSAPYSSQNLRQLGTDTDTRRIYPSAFRVVTVNEPLVEDHWDRYVFQVQHGDVLLFRTWYAAPENALVRLIYREAELRRQSLPNVLDGANANAIIAASKSDSEAVRYHAAARLGQTNSPAARAALSALLDDSSAVVRKQALVSLQRLRAADPLTIERLLSWLTKAASPIEESLRGFVADALGAAGETAVPELVGVLAAKDSGAWPYAIRALGRTGTSDADAHAALLRFLVARNTPRTQYREAAVKALGEVRAAAAVPSLVKMLDEEAPNTEYLRQAAVIALGKIGDKRAAGPLIAHFDRSYTTVVVFSIKQTLDTALASLTGQQNLIGKDDWKSWWENMR